MVARPGFPCACVVRPGRRTARLVTNNNGPNDAKVAVQEGRAASASEAFRLDRWADRAAHYRRCAQAGPRTAARTRICRAARGITSFAARGAPAAGGEGTAKHAAWRRICGDRCDRSDLDRSARASAAKAPAGGI